MNLSSDIRQNKIEKWIDSILWITFVSIPVLILPIDVPDIFDSIKAPVLVLSGISLLTLLILNKKWDNSLLIKLLLIYLFIILISSIFAYNPLLAFVGETPRGGRFEGFITLFIYGLLFYSSKNHLVITQKKIIISFSILLLISIYAHIQFYQYDPLVIYRRFRPMIFSLIGNQNFLGSLMVLLSLISFGLSALYRKWYYYLFFGLFFSTLLVAQTRGCWIAFALGFVLLSIYLFIYKKIQLSSFLLSIMLMIIVITGLNYTKKNVLSKRSKTIKNELTLNNEYGGSGRLKIWNITFQVIKSHPIFGTGPENLKLVVHNEFKKEIQEYYRVKGTSFDKAHNEYLHIAAVTGVPSLIVYLLIVITVIVNKIKVIKTDKVLNVIFLISVIGYLFQATFNISVIAVAPVYWILLGYLSRSNEEVFE